MFPSRAFWRRWLSARVSFVFSRLPGRTWPCLEGVMVRLLSCVFAVGIGGGMLLSPATVMGQVAQAELRGVVVDESGAVLPAVTVTATQTETGTSRTSFSSETGAFVMPALPIGLY